MRLAAFLLALLAALPCRAAAQGAAAPSGYDAVTDRGTRPKPALPAPGMAGSALVDPAFGSRLWRVTDPATRPGQRNRSFRTPSGTHQNAWSASGRHFYVISSDGTIVPFTFDPSSGRAARIEPSSADEGGLVLRFYIEPHFSYVREGVIYGSASGGSLRTIDQYDFAARAYARLLDLDTLVPGLDGTYVGGIGSSAGPVERIFTFFGGRSQDRHHYLAVFEAANVRNLRLLDTKASRLDGRPTNIRLDFLLHAAAIDRSGRYVMLYPTGAERAAPRSAAPTYLWDTATDLFTELPSIEARTNGHDAYGYGVRVNQDCCTGTTWDAAQWQLRSLADPLATRDAIRDVLLPKQVYLADHPSWHNARPDRAVPFISALYRHGANTVEWRAWDDEIVAIGTAPGEGVVWRLAHHRSDVRHDGDPGRTSFWYTPRPNVSQDGRWVLFTSNWEKTLGTDPSGDAGGRARQDVFLLRLEAGSSEPEGSADAVPSTTLTLPDARRGRLYMAQLSAPGLQLPASWRILSGALPPGMRLVASTGRLGGTTRTAGTFAFTVQANDRVSTRRISVTLTVR